MIEATDHGGRIGPADDRKAVGSLDFKDVFATDAAHFFEGHRRRPTPEQALSQAMGGINSGRSGVKGGRGENRQKERKEESVHVRVRA
jgi:hypothetical protein